MYPDNTLGNPGPFHPLSPLVDGLQVEFQGTAGFVRTWQLPLPPTRVRVTLWLARLQPAIRD